MVKSSLLEKLIVNACSPLDYSLNFIGCLTEFPLDPARAKSRMKKNYWNRKVRDYERLLNALSNGKEKVEVGRNYMKTPCGRLQVGLALVKGLIRFEEYRELLKHYEFFNPSKNPEQIV